MNGEEESHWLSRTWQEPMGMEGMEGVGEAIQKKKKKKTGWTIIVFAMLK